MRPRRILAVALVGLRPRHFSTAATHARRRCRRSARASCPARSTAADTPPPPPPPEPGRSGERARAAPAHAAAGDLLPSRVAARLPVLDQEPRLGVLLESAPTGSSLTLLEVATLEAGGHAQGSTCRAGARSPSAAVTGGLRRRARSARRTSGRTSSCNCARRSGASDGFCALLLDQPFAKHGAPAPGRRCRDPPRSCQPARRCWSSAWAWRPTSAGVLASEVNLDLAAVRGAQGPGGGGAASYAADRWLQNWQQTPGSCTGTSPSTWPVWRLQAAARAHGATAPRADARGHHPVPGRACRCRRCSTHALLGRAHRERGPLQARPQGCRRRHRHDGGDARGSMIPPPRPAPRRWASRPATSPGMAR